MRGVVFFWTETGTEGGHWAFQDGDYIYQHPTLGQQFKYEGLHILADGDELTVFDKADPTKIAWQGVIKLEGYPVFTQEASGLWIHNDQQGISRADWAKFFLDEHPAELKGKLCPTKK